VPQKGIEVPRPVLRRLIAERDLGTAAWAVI
jgi:hypothetical protein